MRSRHAIERIDTVVIGAGQAGLSTGYHLKRLGVPFVIVDAGRRVGDTWRERWDSLRLFTPARYAGLDGMPFPAPPHSFPTKDEMGDFLERYADHFQLPIELDVRVTRVSRQSRRLLVAAGDRRFEAANVVVAMATFQRPRVPAFAPELDPAIVQLHSFDYRNPNQLREGPALVVGAGNSGAEIALDVAGTHRTWLAGRDTGHVPFDVDSRVARYLFPVVLRGLFHRVLTVRTPVGRRVRPKVLHVGGPLVRTKPQDLDAAGIERLPRVVGARAGQPLLADGRVLEATNVIWCTGFHPGFAWLDLPVFDAQGNPQHEAGVVPAEPGLYFVGLHFLYAYSSTMIHGVGRDAERIARHVAARAQTQRQSTLAAGAA